HKQDGYTTEVDLPAATTATVSVPVSGATSQVDVNGKPMSVRSAEGGERAVLVLSASGQYVIHSR
ncbi:MAG: hypothetical protein ACLGQU_01880, partial [Acidobacteriota bacterium]